MQGHCMLMCENHAHGQVALGRHVAQAREDVGLTQEDLGRAVNLDRSAISLLEKGDRKLNVPELVEIVA